MFATTVTAGTAGVVPYGIARLLAGLVFCVGLVLVIAGGAELFTGNTLIVMAWMSEADTHRNAPQLGAGARRNLAGAVATAGTIAGSRFAGGHVEHGVMALVDRNTQAVAGAFGV